MLLSVVSGLRSQVATGATAASLGHETNLDYTAKRVKLKTAFLSESWITFRSPLISVPESTPILSMSIASSLLANGALHVAGTYRTGRYSPGTITSVLCYFPSAIFAWITIPPVWHMGTGAIVRAILLGAFWQLIPLAFIVLGR